MSSSKLSRIIKVGAVDSHPLSITSYDFDIVFDEQSPREDLPESTGFVPLFLGGSSPRVAPDPVPPPVEETVVSPPDLPGMVVLSEEELQSRVNEVFQNGLEEGRRQAERGLANVFKSLRDGVAALNDLRSRVVKESEEDLLKLAVMIARKVIQQEITQSPRVLSRIVAAAVSECSDRDRVVIHLNPNDYAVVAADRQVFLGALGEEGQISLISDDAIGPGGCLVETATGTVDARIEAQLDELYRALLEERSTPVDAVLPTVGENLYAEA